MGGAVGVGDGEVAVGVEVEFPAAFVGEMVVAAAEGQQIVDVGRAMLEGVPGDVVRLGVFEWCVAQRTGAIEHLERAPLLAVRQPCFATQKDAHSVGGDDHR